MNLQTMLDYLSLQAPVKTKDLEELERLVSQYPWFTIGQQLLLKGYKDTSNERFNELSKVVPLYVLSRRRLFLFLEKTPAIDDNLIELDMESVIESIPVDQQDKIGQHSNDNLLMSFNNEFFSLEQFVELEEQEETTPTDELIAKFIQANPRIIPKMIIVDNQPENIIKESVEEELVSETLANIYIQQGLYDLAVACYEKLSLQDPQKSVYFAGLIESVKDKKLK